MSKVNILLPVMHTILSWTEYNTFILSPDVWSAPYLEKVHPMQFKRQRRVGQSVRVLVDPRERRPSVADREGSGRPL